MPSIVDTGFGANLDNIIGQQANITIRQIALPDYRARTILAGNAGAVIRSIHVTPRTGLTASGSGFPAAGMFSLLGIIASVPMDVAQMQLSKVPDDFQWAERCFLNRSCSTLITTDIIGAEFYIPPNKYGHIICRTPEDSTGTQLATSFDLTVNGHQLDGGSIPVKLR